MYDFVSVKIQGIQECQVYIWQILPQEVFCSQLSVLFVDHLLGQSTRSFSSSMGKESEYGYFPER